MPASPRAILSLALVAALLAPSAASSSRAADADDLLAAAAHVPADVTMFLHVEGARAIARDLAPRPIGQLFKHGLASGDIELAWGRLADQAGRGQQELFEEWLGERATLVLRPTAGATDWALITVVDEDVANNAMRRLNPRRLTPRAALPVVELPEHGLLVARDGTTFLIGPTRPAVLFKEVLKRLVDDDAGPTLAAHPAMLRAKGLGAGQAAIFAQHGTGLGGWSVAIADLRDGELRLRHAARFVHPLFSRPIPTRAFDMAALDALEDATLMAVIEPTEIGPTGFETFASNRLRAPLLSGRMGDAMGDVRIFALGEVEGRQANPPADQLLPAAAIAIKLEEPDGAERILDEHVLRLARAFNRLVEPAAGQGVAVPHADAFEPGVPRSLDLEPLMAGVGPDLPLLRSATLNWTVASGACGSFWVVATHPEHLGQTVAAIEAADGTPRMGTWASCGTMNGQRLSRHLRSYSDQAHNLAAPGEENAAAFRDTLLILSDLADGVTRCRWRLGRPAPREMDLELEAILRAPESAEPSKNDDD